MRALRQESGASILPWLVVVAVAALAGGLIFKMNSSNAARQQELAALRLEVKELETLRTEAQELPALRALAARAEALKKDAADLPRLRGEVTRLRAEQQQLAKVQGEVQRLQGALQQAQAGPQTQPADVATAAPISPNNPANLQIAQARAFRTACVANLRQLDGAKATWALENRKTGSDVPVDGDLYGQQSYIRERPVCPADGTYVLFPVDTKPACTIPGHTM
jgi:hypothetical protein